MKKPHVLSGHRRWRSAQAAFRSAPHSEPAGCNRRTFEPPGQLHPQISNDPRYSLFQLAGSPGLRTDVARTGAKNAGRVRRPEAAPTKLTELEYHPNSDWSGTSEQKAAALRKVPFPVLQSEGRE